MVFKRLTGLTRIFQCLVLSPRITSRVWIRPLRAFTLLPSCPSLTSVPTQLTAPSLRSIPAPADISHAPRLLLLVAEVPAQTQLCTWRLRRPPRQATFCVPCYHSAAPSLSSSVHYGLQTPWEQSPQQCIQGAHTPYLTLEFLNKELVTIKQRDPYYTYVLN